MSIPDNDDPARHPRVHRLSADVLGADPLGRIGSLGSRLAGLGLSEGSYFQASPERDVDTLRSTRDRLSERLVRADAQVQIITVQGRAEREGRTYALLPTEVLEGVLARTVEAVEASEPEFVPITRLIREELRAAGSGPLPRIEAVPLGARGRSRPVPIPAFEPERG